MKTLIIGYGSIGKRHARLLKPMVKVLAVVTQQTDVSEYAVYTDLKEALEQFQPEYIVICSATNLHAKQLAQLKALGFSGIVLVEKPLATNLDELEASYPFTVYVGYNLRFHPIITALRRELSEEVVLTALAYVGQHLAQWRAGRAPKDTYSAHKDQGGGALRDLSHEIDLLHYLFGPLQLHSACVARTTDVTVDSDDASALILRNAQGGVISLQMNYLDHAPRRFLNLVTANRSVWADLITGEITISENGKEKKTLSVKFAADDSYHAMHQAILSGAVEHVCGLADGRQILQLIKEASA